MNSPLRRRALTAALVFGFVGALAPGSVFALVGFEDAPATVAPDTEIALRLRVANENGADDFNVKVFTRLPEGWSGVSCETKPTWTCEIVTVSQREEVHFEKDESAGPAEDEIFEFTLRSSATLGTATFPTLQTYAIAGEVGWVGDPDTEFPAPTLEVADPTVATTTPAATTTAAPATTAAATTTLAPATTAVEVTTTTAEPAPTSEAPTGGTTVDTATIAETTVTTVADSDSDGGNAGIIIAILLLVAAAVAGTIAYLRRRTPPVPPTDGTPTAVIDPGLTGAAATSPEVLDPTIENPDLGKPTDGSE